MPSRKKSLHRSLPILVLASALLTGVPIVSVAQTNSGFNFVWGGDGPSGKQQLGYVLEYGTPRHLNDRYRLQIKRQNVAIDRILISYPDYFDGTIRPEKVELRYAPKNKIFNLKKGKTIPVNSVTLDKDSRILEIEPTEYIPAETEVEVVLHNVKNPTAGTFFFNCRISSPTDTGLMRYVGTWIISIFRS
jgi:hypothetical protein